MINKFVKEGKTALFLVLLLTKTAFSSTEEFNNDVNAFAVTASTVVSPELQEKERLIREFENEDFSNLDVNRPYEMREYLFSALQNNYNSAQLARFYETNTDSNGRLVLSSKMRRAICINTIGMIENVSARSIPSLFPIGKIISDSHDSDALLINAAIFFDRNVIDFLSNLPENIRPTQQAIDKTLFFLCKLASDTSSDECYHVPSRAAHTICSMSSLNPTESLVIQLFEESNEYIHHKALFGFTPDEYIDHPEKYKRIRQRYRALFLSGEDCGSTNNIIYRLPRDLAQAVAQYI
jgi:hypothetical protein